VAATLASAGLPPTAVEPGAPSLEDVFIKVIRDAGARSGP
jgi:hypothetical protein